MRVLRAVLFALLLVPTVARAEGYAELGTLERSAVDVALAARGLVVDPAPQGKIVGAIQVVNLEVFQPSDGRLLEWFNHFHRTTREEHIRRESLLLVGIRYDALLVDETMRILRNRTSYSTNDPPLSSIVAMVPIQTTTRGTVDLLMVTRDVWSLRLNSDWLLGLVTSDIPSFSASLSENNLFGWRKQPALAFIMDEGEVWLGPNYLDPNVAGTHLRLTAAAYEIWARKIGELAAGPREGSSSWLRLEYPFYALSRRWGGFVDTSYTTKVVRDIVGPGGPRASSTLARYEPSQSTCAVPTGEAGDPYAGLTADCAYRSRTGGVASGITRSFPSTWLVQRVTAGNELVLNRLSFLPNFPTDPEIRQSYAAYKFGPSERTSSLYVQYDAFTPRYRTYRNLNTFDLGEDLRLGPSVTLKLGRASTLLGSEADFFPFKTEAHLNLGLLGGFQSIGASWESRAYGNGLRDHLIKGQLYAATPVLARAFRVVVSANTGLVADNQHRSAVYVGWVEGLRGYPVNTFYGYNYYLAHLELRSTAFSLWSLRVGGLLFADAGHAANTWRGLDWYDTAGVGLRVLIPQLNADVLRCDWGFPLKDDIVAGVPIVRSGLASGLAYCGFRQAF
jgi:hypothetical protein